jgi:hypothetical protein
MRIAFPTDEHVPFQDDEARQVALKILEDFKPDLMITGSDGLDFYGLSTFDKNPQRIKSDLQDEINKWKEIQREWRNATPGAKRVFITGNHEDRLRRYLWKHPEIASLDAVTIPNLFDLISQGITWDMRGDILSDEYQVNDLLTIKHGTFVRQGSGMSARAELQDEHFSISTCTGHTHRGGSFFARTRAGVVQGHECFCLCKLDPEYKTRPDWQQGLVVIETSDDFVHVEPIPFSDFRRRKRAIWRGKEYFS